MPRTLAIATSMFLAVGVLHAQATAPVQSAGRVDIAVTYTGDRTMKANTSQSSWIQGGAFELGATIGHGFGLAAVVEGGHTSSIGSSGVPFSSIAMVFGPRYRFHAGPRLSVYGEGLVGESNAFDTTLPFTATAASSGSTIALQVGGGVDYFVSRHIGVRANAAWLRTQYKNSTDNLQNDLEVGAGVVFRFGR